jgi:hypothetical protein
MEELLKTYQVVENELFTYCTNKVIPSTLVHLGVIGSFRRRSQIWVCERAKARSHTQIWGFITVIPREPHLESLKGSPFPD